MRQEGRLCFYPNFSRLYDNYPAYVPRCLEQPPHLQKGYLLQLQPQPLYFTPQVLIQRRIQKGIPGQSSSQSPGEAMAHLV